MDVHSKEIRSKNMRAIRSSGSKIERILGKEMWKRGCRYRKNDKSIVGKPDFVFKRKKIAVFCDGEFWHGKDWDIRKKNIKTNREFWINKIEGHINRDERVNQSLKENGWKVIRFWGEDILRNPEKCAELVLKELDKK